MKQRNGYKTGNTVLPRQGHSSIIPRVASGRYSTLYPQANYALYHILGALEAAGCTLPSLNTDFRTAQCRYFFQVRMNLSIELRLGIAHALVESSNSEKSLCSRISKILPPHTVIYLDVLIMHFQGQRKKLLNKSRCEVYPLKYLREYHCSMRGEQQ